MTLNSTSPATITPINSFILKKEIEEQLNLIIDDFTEILGYLKYSEKRKEEFQSYVFAKKRAVSISNRIAKIFSLLVQLKYKSLEHYKDLSMSDEVGFSKFYKDFRKHNICEDENIHQGKNE